MHFNSSQTRSMPTMMLRQCPICSETLKNTFGYSAFRSLQQEIIQSSLEGRDVFALLPTGGGKSLCFQLPALLRQGLTVVVSPLIALMKDQVDQLQAAGVAATFLNSTLDAPKPKPGFAVYTGANSACFMRRRSA